MAHALRLSIVAEGVETAEQLSFLRDEGCDEGQGFLFSRPLPTREFRALLESRSEPPFLE
jgi:EAL domain-containing protein (putative c-di-GMP-specific phosphodiesterase class I)